MTSVTIVSGFTTIPQGRVELGKLNLNETTILDAKLKIQHLIMDEGVPVEKQMLWWKGYKLDNDDQTLLDACIEPGKDVPDEGVMESLALFLTVPLERSRSGSESSESASSVNLAPILAKSFSDLMLTVRQELSTSAKVEGVQGCNIV